MKYGVFDSGKAHTKGAIGAAGVGSATTLVVLLNVLAGTLREKGYLPWPPEQDFEIVNTAAIAATAISAYIGRFQLNKRKHT